MKNLIKWELKQSFKSKAFWGFGIFYVLFGALMLILDMSSSESSITGYEWFFTICNNLNSTFLLSIGIYSGIHTAGAFEERRVQAAIMAGNSRFKVVLAKLLSFSLVVAIYGILSLGTHSVIGFLGAKEMGIDSLWTVIGQGMLYVLVEVSFVSVCFFVSMFVKKLGAAIAINEVTLILIDLATELSAEKTWSAQLMKFTPAGQTVYSLMGTSPADIMTSIFVAVFGILITLGVTYMIFRKDELK